MGKPRTDRTGLFLYEGKTLEEWLPSVVERVVERCDPLKVILFGSLARGEANYDSDVDLLVVFEHVELENKRELAVDISRAIVGVPVGGAGAIYVAILLLRQIEEMRTLLRATVGRVVALPW